MKRSDGHGLGSRLRAEKEKWLSGPVEESSYDAPPPLHTETKGKALMSRILRVFALLCVGLSILTGGSFAAPR